MASAALAWVLLALLAGGGGCRGEEAPGASDKLPPECQHDFWREFLSTMQQICRDGTCMNHPLVKDKAAGALLHAMEGTDVTCTIGLGAAAALMLRSVTTRLRNVVLVDADLGKPEEGRGGQIFVTLALSVWDRAEERRMPIDLSFAPFPYDARTLAPFRVRSWLALAQLYRGAARVLTGGGIPHFAWYGSLRFWSELVGALELAAQVHPQLLHGKKQLGPEVWGRTLTMPTQDYALDMLVPLEMEQALLRLKPDFEEHGRLHPLELLWVHSVVPGRMAQIIMTNFPEFGDGVDARHICPSCIVLNIYFYKEEDQESVPLRALRIYGERPPCRIVRSDIFPLRRMDDFDGFPEAFVGQLGAGLMPAKALNLLQAIYQEHFQTEYRGPPCFWHEEESKELGEALRRDAALGPISAFVARKTGPEDLGTRPGDGEGDRGGAGSPFILASTDYSEEIERLSDGVRGWFEFMELRMGAQRPALQGFQQKVWMKSLMLERGVPIPRLLYTSEESPLLPFDGPDLPRIQEGYCVKPAHLAESHHTFAITRTGVDLLTGTVPTLAEVQGNISAAWSHSLGDYDRAARSEGGGCAVSGVHAEYINGRPCTNWALYSCPPGLVIEELVRSSPFYENFKTALLHDDSSETGDYRQPPDEIKCHVVWGKVFVAEWVTPKLMLGYVFRHGFVKSTIIVSPEYTRTCYGGERFDSGQRSPEACHLQSWWRKIVDVAERAVPAGVDYMRVDIFPNGWEPVVNELSVAGYATLLEDWMLAEMLRRVKVGYDWRAGLAES